ncbi:hypothetical protein [Buchananella hordeovulneris]|uniref:hypothetical protein n=1 Tax=Buchananella hordeovulneris TaxID=52770 RepID=UPI000F5D4ECA|nr:hypothetical protein [Buchananella hordeovulneris]RRD45494.1 hypothetical protein EII13_01125 [Buchananella hordeovulneris]
MSESDARTGSERPLPRRRDLHPRTNPRGVPQVPTPEYEGSGAAAQLREPQRPRLTTQAPTPPVGQPAPRWPASPLPPGAATPIRGVPVTPAAAALPAADAAGGDETPSAAEPPESAGPPPQAEMAPAGAGAAAASQPRFGLSKARKLAAKGWSQAGPATEEAVTEELTALGDSLSEAVSEQAAQAADGLADSYGKWAATAFRAQQAVPGAQSATSEGEESAAAIPEAEAPAAATEDGAVPAAPSFGSPDGSDAPWTRSAKALKERVAAVDEEELEEVRTDTGSIVLVSKRPRKSRLRRLLAWWPVALALALLGGVGVAIAVWQAQGADESQSSQQEGLVYPTLKHMTVAGRPGALPSMVLEQPLEVVDRVESVVTRRGNGTPIRDGARIVLALTTFNGTTGERTSRGDSPEVRVTYATPQHLPEWLYHRLLQVPGGSRVLVTHMVDDREKGQYMEIVVADVLRHRVSYNSSLYTDPTVTFQNDEEPVLSKVTGEVPDRTETHTVVIGGGEQVQPGARIVAQFVLIDFQGNVISSTFKRGGPEVVDLNRIQPVLAEAVIDRQVGSRIVFRAPAALAGGDKPVAGMIDILAVIEQPTNPSESPTPATPTASETATN